MKLINFNVGIDQPLFLIAGPCVIESEDMTLRVADELKNICMKLDVPFIFKSSFDKANRSSNRTFRGFGMEKGLRILEKVKAQFDLPLLTDVHTTDQVKPVSEVVDVLQTPAFLCRQTDFIIAVAAEEYGLLLCLLIIFVYSFIVVRSMRRLTSEVSVFVRLSGVGITSLLAMQSIINLGVAVRLLPAKGMTLPFISYGGSSLLAMGLLMGLLLALTRKRPKNDFRDILGRGV